MKGKCIADLQSMRHASRLPDDTLLMFLARLLLAFPVVLDVRTHSPLALR